MMCSRMKLTPLLMSSTASRALIPFSGSPAEWAVLPWKWNLTLFIALLLPVPAEFALLGWWLRQASTPSK